MRKCISILCVVCMLVSLTACSQISSQLAEGGEDNFTTDIVQSDVSITEVLSDLDGYYSDTFGTGEITEVNIEIDEADWDDLCETAMEETYYSVDITVNGTTVTDVGFRTKGASSLRSVAESDSNRYGFKIKFDEYVDDQTLNGLDMMVLNGSFSDPSYMREYLAYAASEYLGCPTPYISYTRLSINGEYFGLYLSIEAYRDSFVEKITEGDEDAVLYKAVDEDCTLLVNDDASGFDVDVGEDEGHSNILRLIEVLNSASADNTSDLENILDGNSVLKAMAVNVVTGNYDSYNGSKAHNYYLLYSDGQFEYIGWDYNMAFGGFTEDGGKSVTVDAQSPFYQVDGSMRPLMDKLLEIEEYNDRYLSYVNELYDYFSDSEEKIAAIADHIRDDVEADPTAFYTIEQFEDNITSSGTDLIQTVQPVTNNVEQPASRPQDMPERDVTRMSTEDASIEPNTAVQTMPVDAGQRPDNNNIGMGKGMMNETVSIVDYIEQRLEILGNMLSAGY